MERLDRGGSVDLNIVNIMIRDMTPTPAFELFPMICAPAQILKNQSAHGPLILFQHLLAAPICKSLDLFGLQL